MARKQQLEQTRPDGRARGIVSSRTSGARVHAHSVPPPDSLTGVVERLWVGRWDLPADAPHETHLLSDPSVHLVFEADEHGPRPGVSGARIVGVWTSMWTRTLQARGLVRAVKLAPGRVQSFLPGPATAYTDRLTPLLEPEIARSVLGPEDDEEGLANLAAWLIARAEPHPAGRRISTWIDWIRHDGITRVDELAARTNHSVRALQRLFAAHVGASPKWLIRRCRLQEVARRIEAGQGTNLADLAYTLGYADQAHLARDFRGATGRTLTAFGAQIADDAGPGSR